MRDMTSQPPPFRKRASGQSMNATYLSNQVFLGGKESWEAAGLFLESDSMTILMLLLGIFSGEGKNKNTQNVIFTHPKEYDDYLTIKQKKK